MPEFPDVHLIFQGPGAWHAKGYLSGFTFTYDTNCAATVFHFFAGKKSCGGPASTSSVTFGCVVGSWLMLKVIILAVGLRLLSGSKHGSPSGEAEDALSTKTEPTAVAVAFPEATKTESTIDSEALHRETESTVDV
jgi:hypothetical protein